MSKAAEPAVRFVTFEEMLQQDGYIVYTNVGVSMLPLLRERRDIIEIRPKPETRCRKYDVVLYKRGKRYILHRVLKVREHDYVIVGDNCIWREYGITDSQILGVMTRVIRGGRTVTPQNRLYRLYVHLWCDFYPIRAAILYVRRLLGTVRRRLKRLLRGQNKNAGRD
ncbi:MAG: S24/S26 family peptidase [Clostridia bacterium]|nr:S24/S26 family peptidase [Clostridia bacterium]